MPQRPIIIVYHGYCLDGSASAWALTRALVADNVNANDITYVPYEHFKRTEAEKNITDALATPHTALYFVDVAPRTLFLDALLTHAHMSTVFIYDHHAGAAHLKLYTPPPSAAAKLHVTIDEHAPAAVGVIYDYLLPNEKLPDVIDYIGRMDADTRRLKTDDDYAAAAYIDAYIPTSITPAFTALEDHLTETFNTMAAKGLPILRDQDMRINHLIKTYHCTTLEILPNTSPVLVPLLNANIRHYGRLVSKRMLLLAEKLECDIIGTWAVNDNGTVSMSLRTQNGVDANEVAQHLAACLGVTGGGHATSAAVHFASLDDFISKIRLSAPPLPVPASFFSHNNGFRAD